MNWMLSSFIVVSMGDDDLWVLMVESTVDSSIADTFGDQYFVCYSEVSPTQGPPVYFR